MTGLSTSTFIFINSVARSHVFTQRCIDPGFHYAKCPFSRSFCRSTVSYSASFWRQIMRFSRGRCQISSPQVTVSSYWNLTSFYLLVVTPTQLKACYSGIRQDSQCQVSDWRDAWKNLYHIL